MPKDENMLSSGFDVSTDAYLNTWLKVLPEQTIPSDRQLLTLHEQFHKQAVLTPKAIAVRDDYRSLTYEELNLRVLVLGEHLRSKFNVGLDSPVGIYMEPSVNYMISLMAAMSAGGCFVTIESTFPLNKIREVVDDSHVKVILTTRVFHTKLSGVDEAPTFIVDDNYDTVMALLKDMNMSAVQLEEKRLAAPQATLDNLSFVVYTSGTTGKPKGIANPHRAPVLSYQWRWSLSNYSGADKVACNVFFIWESIRPLLRGAATYCINDETIYNPTGICSFVERHKITELLFTPTLFQNVVSQMSKKQVAEKMRTLKTVYFNGEVLSKEVARRAIEYLPNTRFINLYSISECHEVGAIDIANLNLSDPPTGFCPVGYPSPLTPPYILDENLQRVKDGEAGELYVTGPLLARNYLNLPEKTEERFPKSPYLDEYVEGGDNRMYRTGDRARILPNGMLEILGRCAFMVKIRGYSVVPGAIEVSLLDAINLKACAVIADGEEGTEKRLVAFLVRNTSGKITNGVPLNENGEPKLTAFQINKLTGACNEIRQTMKLRLAHYMVPSVYIELDELPLNATSGKLDNKVLHTLAKKQQESISNPNASDRHHRRNHNKRLEQLQNSYKYMKLPDDVNVETVENVLLLAWEGILTLPFGSIQRGDDFVSLGGHSLSAARLVNAIESMFSVKLPVKNILQGITVKHQARDIVNALDVKAGRKKIKPVKKGAAELLLKVNDSACIPSIPSFQVNLKPSKGVPDLNQCKQVFLTGATGFFGAHLLFEILMSGVEKVVCIVRKRSGGKDSVSVIKENLRSYGLLRPLGKSFEKIVAVTGDLSRIGFGVDGAFYDRVLMSSDGIVHCAAFVSLVETFENLVESNVQGTKEVIKLAAAIKSRSGVSPRGVYISTNGIFPLKRLNVNEYKPVGVEDCDFNNLPSEMVYGYDGSKIQDVISSMCNGYGLSKWAAEKIVTTSSEAFGLSFSTYRMGNLSPNSKTGHSNPFDFQCMIIRGCEKVGAAPVVPEWRIEGTPVDLAAKNVVKFASGQQEGNKVYHLVQPRHTPWPEVVSWMNEIRLEKKMEKLKLVNWNDWRKLVSDAAKTSVSTTRLLGLIDLLPNGGMEYLSCQPYLKCSESFIDTENIDKNDISANTLKMFFNRLKIGKQSFEAMRVGVQPGNNGENESAVAPRLLQGKVAIVTGASSGIGRGIAIELARAGCNVALAARRLEQLEISRKLISEACTNGTVDVICVPTDVTDREAMINCVAVTEDILGPVDILVNNAGVMYYTLMKNVHWDDWERTVNVNCKGPMHGIGAVLPQMIARGKGHIINITSDAGVTAFAGLGVYSGSKFFVEGMSKALRLETASTGVRVTCIQPGNVETPLLATSTDPEGIKLYGEPSGAKVLEPVDIGRAVVYAATQPEWCAINNMLVEPREEPT